MRAFIHRFAEPVRGGKGGSMGTKTYTDVLKEANDQDPGSMAMRVFAGGVKSRLRGRIELGTRTVTKVAREDGDHDRGREHAYFPR